MLASVLSLLTVSAVVLVVPVFAGVLGMQRHRHLAVGEDGSRRVRLVVAATLVGLATLGLAAVLHARPVQAAVVAVLIAGAVLVWAPLAGSWAVRGVVVWALLVTAAVGLLAWLVDRIATSTLPGVWLVVSAGAWLLLLVSMLRVQRYARDLISAQAGFSSFSRRHRRISLMRPAVSLVVLFTAGGVVAVATTHGAVPGRGRAPQAGTPGLPGTYAPPPVAPSLTQGAAAPAFGIDLAAATWRRGGPRLDARPRAAATIFGPLVPGPTGVGPTSSGVSAPLAGPGATGGASPAAAPPTGRTPSRSGSDGGATAVRPQPAAGKQSSTMASPTRTPAPMSEGPVAAAEEAAPDSSAVTTDTRPAPARTTSAITDRSPAEAARVPDNEHPNRPSTGPSAPSVPSAASGQQESSPPPSVEPSVPAASAPSASAPSASAPSAPKASKPSDAPGSNPSEPLVTQAPDPRDTKPTDPQGSQPSSAPRSKPSDLPGKVATTPGSKPSDLPSQAAGDGTGNANASGDAPARRYGPGAL